MLSVKSFLFSILLSLCCISLSFANTVPEPQRILEKTSTEMLQLFMEKSDDISKDPEIAHTLIREHLISKINFKLMSRWVLGSNWKKSTPEQQQEFVIVFKELVIKFYSKALLEYLSKYELEPGLISFKPFAGKIKGKYTTIRSLINPPGGAEPINVNYDMYHNKAGQWQVYDISIEGISLVTSYRSSFKKVIKEQGMDALLSQLREKTLKLNEPAIASNKTQ